MLVLTRKTNQKVSIGDDVTITVLRVKGNTIRLGIEAPRGVRVIRSELRPFESTGAPTAEGQSVEEGGSDSADEPCRFSVEANWLGDHADLEISEVRPTRGPLQDFVVFKRLSLPAPETMEVR